MGRRVLTTMLIALLVWALLDAPALTRSADGAPLGTRRTVALDLLRPVARLDDFLSLDRLDRLDRLGHRPRRDTPAVIAEPTVAAQPMTDVPNTSTTTPPGPLRVLVVGDSVAADLGNRLAAILDARGSVTFLDTRPATGLARPDAFNWPSHLAADLAADHPAVVVAMWGANDAQAMPLPSGPAGFGSQEWDAAYAARVSAVATECRQAGARLLWVGEPVMRSQFFDARMQAIDAIVRQVTAHEADVRFSDTRAVLATASGAYADALPGAGGSLVLVRATDGIHLTWAGADRLARFEDAALQEWIRTPS